MAGVWTADHSQNSYGDNAISKLRWYVDRLLDLSQRNKSIYFAISQDGVSDWKLKTKALKLHEEVINKLLEDERLRLLSYWTGKGELVSTLIDFEGADWREAEKKLRDLYSRNRDFLKDYGFGICYLIYGFLIWCEKSATGKGLWVKSPLLVAEVDLERRLERRQGQVEYTISLTTPFRINESIIEILLQQFGIDLLEALGGFDEVTELEDSDRLRDILRGVEEVVSKRGWRVELEAWIAGLSFETIGLYRDAKQLLESGRLLASPIIRAICGEELDPPLSFPNPPNEHEIDRVETPLPADRYQCEVIWYAEKGENLVVHGPPGTGKSQTIANLIARLIPQGKKVLFVAERREAIDVVYSRLEELGLTFPVLKVFTISDRERDEVLNELYKTVVLYEVKSPSKLSESKQTESIIFPEEDYTYESRYFKFLTEDLLTENSSEKALYHLIGEITLIERKLEQDNLYDLIKEYLGKGIWSEYRRLRSRSGEIIEAYWGELLEALRLPFQPSLGDISTIPKAIKILDDIKKYFGEVPLQQVLRILNLLERFHNKFQEFVKPQESINTREVIRHCLILNYDMLLDLNRCLRSFYRNLLEWIQIERELRGLPNVTLLLEAEQRLQPYKSWLKRSIFSRGNYNELRRWLEEELRISRRLSHKEAEENINKFLKKNEIRNRLRDLAREIRNKRHENILRIALTNEVLKQIACVIHITNRMLEYIQDLSKAEVELVKKAPEFFIENLAEDPEPLTNLLRKMPQNISSLEDLSRSLMKTEELLRGLDKAGQRNLIRIFNEIRQIPVLQTFLRKLPEWVSFEKFEEIVRYLMLYDICIEYFNGNSSYLDWRVAEISRTRIGNFYGRMKENISDNWLRRWLSMLSIPRHAYKYRFYDTLRREYSKKRRKISLRQLFNEYLHGILKVKPILMMSPTSVSALLPRNFSESVFDIIIFDEASQMRVERALPSIARAKQLITIGDENQMPPSRYFETVFHGEEEEEWEEPPESLLHACLNAPRNFFKELWLKWYYRGSHESLIAFSNKYFYNNELIVMPSIDPTDSRVEFIFVECPVHPRGGCYTEGRGTNECEARIVVLKLLEELSKPFKDDYTIGIVAVNEKQQYLIEDVIEEICRTRDLEILGINERTLDRFIDGVSRKLRFNVSEELWERLEEMWYSDKIWVRNLESVQGKEAEYIILSMTYGRGADGKLRQHFGPINLRGGERRINVLISRAREKMIVVSSMKSSDIRVDENTPRGVNILKEFLKYAEEGGRIIEEKEGGWFESPFEESVYHHLLDILSDLGVQVVPQVGVGEYRIDIGIRKDGRYILGIECDGASYHKHKAARERDWIRERRLREMGWDIYRIWSTAWFDRMFRRRILEDIRSKVLEKLYPQ